MKYINQAITKLDNLSKTTVAKSEELWKKGENARSEYFGGMSAAFELAAEIVTTAIDIDAALQEAGDEKSN